MRLSNMPMIYSYENTPNANVHIYIVDDFIDNPQELRFFFISFSFYSRAWTKDVKRRFY